MDRKIDSKEIDIVDVKSVIVNERNRKSEEEKPVKPELKRSVLIHKESNLPLLNLKKH